MTARKLVLYNPFPSTLLSGRTEGEEGKGGRNEGEGRGGGWRSHWPCRKL